MAKSYCWYCGMYVDCEERGIKELGKINSTKRKFCTFCGVMLG